MHESIKTQIAALRAKQELSAEESAVVEAYEAVEAARADKANPQALIAAEDDLSAAQEALEASTPE